VKNQSNKSERKSLGMMNSRRQEWKAALECPPGLLVLLILPLELPLALAEML